MKIPFLPYFQIICSAFLLAFWVMSKWNFISVNLDWYYEIYPGLIYGLLTSRISDIHANGKCRKWKNVFQKTEEKRKKIGEEKRMGMNQTVNRSKSFVSCCSLTKSVFCFKFFIICLSVIGQKLGILLAQTAQHCLWLPTLELDISMLH
jgi:hypothetical protein